MKKQKQTYEETTDELWLKLKSVEKHLQEECSKCDGTGKPRTKTGEPAKTGKNVKCKECSGTGSRGYKMDILFKSIVELKRDISKIRDDLRTHMNRQTAEIRVLPKGHNPALQGNNSNIAWENGWEDYTGVFFIDPEDEKEIVLSKARKHFEEYFEKGVYHRNKKLGIFLSSARSGKRLIEAKVTE